MGDGPGGKVQGAARGTILSRLTTAGVSAAAVAIDSAYFCRQCIHRRREPTPHVCEEGLPVREGLRTPNAAMTLTPGLKLTCLMVAAYPLSLFLLSIAPLPLLRPPHLSLLSPSLPLLPLA